MANDLNAVRRIVEDATAGYAGRIACACGWTHGNPAEITVDEKVVTVRYAGALPRAVAGPLKEGIVDDLMTGGFDYRGAMFGRGAVHIVPSEDD